jgi:precorrin-2 dehydrogenase/sirohydrochlorin ferrochelatase
MYFPIVLKVGGEHVVVIGGGEVAEGKVRSLMDAGAKVTLVSPEAYQASDIAGALLVIAATDDVQIQERVWRDAHEKRILVNTVDEPERCDFIMPSVVRRDDLIVAVSTSGKSPAFAAWLQRRLAEFVTADFGRVVSLLGSIRDEVRRRFKTVPERKRVYQRVIDTGIVDWIGNCDDATAKAHVRKILEES